ncbi:MAG: hypothetical protein J5379_08600 [Clostridiales bacterium]|nr:hypothetical protein [Clostridiales bacterium]
MYLYHYFDKRSGPFNSLSKLSKEEAERVLDQVKCERPDSQSAKRDQTYVWKRWNCEAILRREWAAKGGLMDIPSPHYMVVEHSPWLSTWFEQGDFIRIPIEEFDLRKVSFTYGDSMPTFNPSVNVGKEYHMKIYTYEEILPLIEKYGLPQDWNDDGAHGPERYIEVHVWTDEPIRRYIEEWNDA